MRGRKPRPGSNPDAPLPPDALPRCPAHLSPVAAKEWRRLAKPLYEMGVLLWRVNLSETPATIRMRFYVAASVTLSS